MNHPPAMETAGVPALPRAARLRMIFILAAGLWVLIGAIVALFVL